jgi:flagellar biosynthesis protein FlhA
MGGNSGKTSILHRLARHTDVAITIAIFGTILAMVIPLPSMLLDFMLSFNIAFALIILLISLYILRPLDFSSFPSVLLVSTISRMALNVSSTRLILLHGHQSESAAGEVIRSFGKFVVGGNYVVGFIVFIILVIIQFVVITKGAGRIAEVAARFTLDAMPGKQMSIDADMNAGLITESEARERRKIISREADFYGAMDGASKFVRGDAIVGIIILFINIIGGLIIGIVQHGMSIAQAGSRYSMMTIGDGLASQLPALIISTASGFIVSRAASDSNFGREVSFQFFSHPKVFAITSGVMLVMGLVPGLPKIPFLMIAVLTGGIAYINRKGSILPQKTATELGEKTAEQQEKTETEEESLERVMEIDPMELEISHTLIPMVDPNENGNLLERIRIMRRQCAIDLGFIVPPIRIRDNIQLKPGEYSILIRGSNVATGKVMMGHYLAMNPGSAIEPIDGIEAQEPVFGLVAHWITANQKDKAELSGYTVVDPETVLITHITETIKAYAHELLGRQELKNLLDSIKETNPNLVEELIPNPLPMGIVHKICANLLREQVSIRDMIRILETLSDYANTTKDADMLTEYVRNALGRTICKSLLNRDGVLKVFTLDPSIEEAFTNAISSDQNHLNLEVKTTQDIINSIALTINNAMIDTQPIVLCSSYVRRHFRKMTERYFPNLMVISYNEIPSNVEIQQVEAISLSLKTKN